MNMRAMPSGLERVDRVEGLGRRRRGEVDELGGAIEAHQCVREVVRRARRRRCERIGVQLPLGREHEVDERRADRGEDVEEKAREPAAEPAHLDERRREQDDERLDEDVAPADVGELVRDRRVELLPPERPQRADGDCERGARGPAPDGEEAREAVVDEVELRRAYAELRGDLIGAGAEHGILGEGERAGAEHSEKRAISVPVHGRRGEQRAEREQECRSDSSDEPAQTAERCREDRDESQCLQEVQRDSTRHALRLSGVVLDEPARRPVGLGGIAAARAVQRRDVLKRDEDVAVELDVGDVLERAVRREDTFLVLAAEESHLDLLALVLVRVVLHEAVSLLARVCRPERRADDRAVADDVDRARRAPSKGTRSAAASAERIGPPWVTARTAASGCSAPIFDEAGDDARTKLVVRLAVVPAVTVLEPAREPGGEARLDLGASEPRPRADVDLHQRRVVERASSPSVAPRIVGRLTPLAGAGSCTQRRSSPCPARLRAREPALGRCR